MSWEGGREKRPGLTFVLCWSSLMGAGTEETELDLTCVGETMMMLGCGIGEGGGR